MRALKRAILVCLLLPALLGADVATAVAQDGDDARYALANGCYALRSQAAGQYVAKTGNGGYRASAASTGEAEPFRMKATQLGQYMFYGRDRDYLAEGSDDPTDIIAGAPSGRLEPASAPSEGSDWRVDSAGAGAFRITLPARNKVVLANGAGDLVLVDAGDTSPGTIFSFEGAGGCPEYPEPELNVTGDPATGSTSFTEVRGLVDAHIHMMAFEFLGGSVHCGRPWHPYGVTVALVDCPDHGPNGRGAVLENALYGDPAHGHDTVGWPTFRDWPHPKSLTHEQTYYRWLERSWRGGLRIYVNLLVDNAVLCELYPLKRNSCNEMDGVRLQARRLRELENYIDAQHGGPGKGWFRIVENPFQARRVINSGKLAVVPGIEVSKLFDCGEMNDQPECSREQIDRQLDEVYKLGVRDMELVNKFDNALTGVAGDSGQTGVVTNNGNRYETGQYWAMQTCTGPEGAEDKNQLTAPGTARDELVGTVLTNFPAPPGTAPVYTAGPHCNQQGLSELGEYLVRRMIDKKMMIDPDHMSVAGRNELLSIVEAERYSGIVSSHTWSSPDANPRIYKQGGFITPYAGSSTDFVDEWRKVRAVRDKRWFFGMGYGADMNGFGSQGLPRGRDVPNPVRYPFKSFDGKVTIDKQVSGERVYDINVDGVAHYGLYPDWVEDLRMLAGQQIVDDMARGPEAYLQMWERAEGVARRRCQPARSDITGRGIGHIRLGASTRRVLFGAGQPARRVGRVYRYCVDRRGKRKRGRMAAVFTKAGKVALVFTSGPNQRVRPSRVGPGSKAPKGRRIGRGLRLRPAGGGASYVFGVRAGKVRFVAVASRAVASSRRSLRAHLKLAGVR